MAKIATSDVFVCDVSIIDLRVERPAPNPNVLVELGFALSALGEQRVIMVMNTAYGSPEQLPFDLRVKRVTKYAMSEEAQERASERNRLAGVLSSGLNLIFSKIGEKAEAPQQEDPRQALKTQMEDIVRSREAMQRREQFRHSPAGVEATKASAEQVYKALLDLAEEHKHESSGYVFSHQFKNEGSSRSELSLYAVGFTLRLDLKIPFSNSIQGHDHSESARIRALIFDGVVRKGYIYEKKPQVKRELVYEFDVDGFGGEGWRLRNGLEDLLAPETVATSILSTFIDFAEKNRTW